MVAVQNLKGEIIQFLLSRKEGWGVGGGMYLVSATPTKLQAGVSLSEVTHSSSFILAELFTIIVLNFFHCVYREAPYKR